MLKTILQHNDEYDDEYDDAVLKTILQHDDDNYVEINFTPGRAWQERDPVGSGRWHFEAEELRGAGEFFFTFFFWKF